jgi:gas vesicle protein
MHITPTTSFSKDSYKSIFYFLKQSGMVFVNYVSNHLLKSKNMKDQAKIIAALLVGAAAGAALGLLLAPEKGEDLRGEIADYVNDLIATAKDKAQTTASSAKEYGSNVVDSVKSKFGAAASDAEAAAAKSKVKSTAGDWNNSVQNV